MLRGNTLIAKFRKCDTQVKEKLFNSYCNNMYGANLWASYSKSSLNSIKYAHCKVFSTLLDIKMTDFNHIIHVME